jgi:hypothetical protein
LEKLRKIGLIFHNHPASYLTFVVVPTGASLHAAAGAQSIDFWAGLYGGAPETADGVLAVLPEHRRVVVLPNTHFDTHKSSPCKRRRPTPDSSDFAIRRYFEHTLAATQAMTSEAILKAAMRFSEARSRVQNENFRATFQRAMCKIPPKE